MTAESLQAGHATERTLLHMSPAFLVGESFKDALTQLGLTSLEAVFAFDAGRDLAKSSIGRFRRRMELELKPTGAERPTKAFLKRYDRPPISRQLRNWLCHHARRSFARVERDAADALAAAGVNTPRTIAYGEQWGLLFERRSFLMTEEIKDSEALERRLPPCFNDKPTPTTFGPRRDFVRRLASFVRRFHETGYRHRDLYLSHIFYSEQGEFCLIDLARASRPILRRRFQIKDIAQLHYSAPATRFSRTDRLRFYLVYAGRRRLRQRDKVFICTVMRKVAKMARHSAKHGTPIPFLDG